MLLREGSEIAEPQNAMLRYFKFEHCKARTSVAVSDNAQQKVRSNSSRFLAALVRCTMALSVKYVQSAKQSFRKLLN